MKRLVRYVVPGLLVLVALLAARAAAGPRATLVALPTMKIQVNKDGWYRVPAATLTAAGFVAPTDPNLLHLKMDGNDVPFQYHSGAVEFYGQALDTLYTGTRTYYLSVGGTEGSHMNFLRARTTAGTAAGSYESILNVADRADLYLTGLLTTANPGAVSGNNRFGLGPRGAFRTCANVQIADSPYSKTLDVGSADVAQASSLELHLYGVTAGTHTVEVRVGPAQTFLGTLVWSGIVPFTQTLAVPANTLTQGVNTITYKNVSPEAQCVNGTVTRDWAASDTYKLTYQHQYVADGEKLSFPVTALTPVSVSGFTNSNVRLIDITNPLSPRELYPTISGSGSAWTISVNPPAGASRLYAFTDAQALAPSSVVQDAPSTLKSASNQADFIVIAYKDASTDLISDVQPLVTQRQTVDLLSVKVVDIEDVYDEFGSPLGAKGPEAIKSFLNYAYTTWQNPKPKYVLLVGDATQDPRNYTNQATNYDYIPTLFFDASFSKAPSDDALADFNNDGKPELAVGRLPVRTNTEANTVVSKIVNYSLTAVRPKTAFLAADNFDRGDYCFGANVSVACPSPPGFSDYLQAQSLTPNSVAVTKEYRQACPGSPPPSTCATDTTSRNNIVAAEQTGPVMVNWFGHGSFQAWNANLMTNADATALTNAGSLSLYLMMTCQTAYFAHMSINGLGEALLLNPNGGAVAMWGSTGDTVPTDQINAAVAATNQLFAASPARLGDAMVSAKNSISDIDVLHTWTLLGDPTMKLRIS